MLWCSVMSQSGPGSQWDYWAEPTTDFTNPLLAPFLFPVSFPFFSFSKLGVKLRVLCTLDAGTLSGTTPGFGFHFLPSLKDPWPPFPAIVGKRDCPCGWSGKAPLHPGRGKATGQSASRKGGPRRTTSQRNGCISDPARSARATGRSTINIRVWRLLTLPSLEVRDWLVVIACGLDWEGYLLACWWLERDDTSCSSFWVEVETHLHSSLFCIFPLWLWVWWLNQVCSFHFFPSVLWGSWEAGTLSYRAGLSLNSPLPLMQTAKWDLCLIFLWLLLFQLCIRPHKIHSIQCHL